jgi:methyltransferase
MSNGSRAKRQKREATADQKSSYLSEDTSRPSARYKPTRGRKHTLSVALPGSIIAKYVTVNEGQSCYECRHLPLQYGPLLLAREITNTTDEDSAVTHDQKTALAGQIARACAVFCVDEIVVFDDGQARTTDPEEGGYTAFADPNFFLFHILSYLETPPHLRKALFPMHPDLRTAGALPSLDMPHHLRSDESSLYREGVTTRKPHREDGQSGTMVECGLQRQVFLPVDLEANVRVTVKLPAPSGNGDTSLIEGEAVAPDYPREEAGYYWGYTVRQASSLSNVFTECPFDGGYDTSIGTSERGLPVASITDRESGQILEPSWDHLLVTFGGVAGLETAVTNDPELLSAGVKEPAELFDFWINLVPGQGSRTIRTEEAVWVGLSSLRSLVEARNSQE